MYQKFEIVGHLLCPYVQRVVILAKEKGVTFDRTDIELDNKPEWLTRLSPTGKVPILIIDKEDVLFESSIICEFLDEVSSGTLYPDCLSQRARLRAWGEFGTGILNCIAKIIYQDKSQESFEESIVDIRERLHLVQKEHSGKLYFYSDDFYLIDAIYATIFRYFNVLTHSLNRDIFDEFPLLSNWAIRLFKRNSIIEAVPPDYQSRLLSFIKSKDTYLSRELNSSRNSEIF